MDYTISREISLKAFGDLRSVPKDVGDSWRRMETLWETHQQEKKPAVAHLSQCFQMLSLATQRGKIRQKKVTLIGNMENNSACRPTCLRVFAYTLLLFVNLLKRCSFT